MTARPSGAFLLGALTESQSHRQHADDHGGGGHEDRPDAGVAGGERGGSLVHAFEALIVGENDHEDAGWRWRRRYT